MPIQEYKSCQTNLILFFNEIINLVDKGNYGDVREILKYLTILYAILMKKNYCYTISVKQMLHRVRTSKLRVCLYIALWRRCYCTIL